MKPQIVDAIVASNAEQVEKAKAAAPQAEPGLWGDTAIQLDSAGQIIEGVWQISGYAAGGLKVVVAGIGEVLDALPSLD